MNNSGLYLIVRTDMDSMTPGRIAAQTAHGHGAMEVLLNTEVDSLLASWNDWKAYRGFGTTLVLQNIDIDSNRVSLEEIELKLQVVNGYGKTIISTYVLDETYPIKDGSTVHLVSVKTVLAVFVVDRENKPDILCSLRLYGGRENVSSEARSS